MVHISTKSKWIKYVSGWMHECVMSEWWGWMSEGTNEWMNKRTHEWGWVSEWGDAWMNKWRWVNEWKWVNEWVNKWMREWWVNGWVNEWMRQWVRTQRLPAFASSLHTFTGDGQTRAGDFSTIMIMKYPAFYLDSNSCFSESFMCLLWSSSQSCDGGRVCRSPGMIPRQTAPEPPP